MSRLEEKNKLDLYLFLRLKGCFKYTIIPAIWTFEIFNFVLKLLFCSCVFDWELNIQPIADLIMCIDIFCFTSKSFGLLIPQKDFNNINTNLLSLTNYIQFHIKMKLPSLLAVLLMVYTFRNLLGNHAADFNARN